MSQNTNSDFIITKEEKEALEKELERLMTEERNKVSEKIKEAVKLGDLSENQQYSDAKEEMEMLERRISKLKERIESAEVIKMSKSGGVSLYSKVTIEFLDTKEKEVFTLVGSTEVDPIQKKYSMASSLGRAIRGKNEGETFTFTSHKGDRDAKVLRIDK